MCLSSYHSHGGVSVIPYCYPVSIASASVTPSQSLPLCRRRLCNLITISLSLSRRFCHHLPISVVAASVVSSLSPCHCHRDVSITPSPSWGCSCRPVSVTVSLSLCHYHGGSTTMFLSSFHYQYFKVERK